MPQWLKVLLLLLVFAVLGLGLLVGGCFWWVSSNKDRLTAGARAAMTEGEAYGKTHSKGDCIDDGMTRIKTCGQVDFVCEVLTTTRLQSCMPVAQDDGACKQIPTDRNVLKEALSGNAECTRRGQAGSQACGRLMQAVTRACARAGR